MTSGRSAAALLPPGRQPALPTDDMWVVVGAVLVKAGSYLLWAFDPYEGARLECALYGSEVGCRLGDD